ncbi:hypothetical protein MTP99_004816 [Tenebrio molitor]|nr:hypothetical protein MTP99_004816 [Tenebrio molitor]
MWSKYSMLKAAIKNQSRGYRPKKAEVLERTHVEEFLTRACDKEYLMIKVMGVSGACRCCELTNLKISDVAYLIVSIPDTKTGVSRKFTILEEGFSINTVEKCSPGTSRSLLETTIRSGTDNNYKLLINGNEVKYDKTKNEMSINVNVNVNIN